MSKAIQETMQCMEVWGGNTSTWSHFNVPGLDLWVYAQPTGSTNHGGDVYYLSSCASGRTTRLFLGDVSGHGHEASPTADSLRQIMRQNVNLIDHSRLVSSINQEFEDVSVAGRFATAVVGTYFLPTGRLKICNAGHPPPFRFNSESRKWEVLGSEGEKPIPKNLPFGIDGNHEYQSKTCRLAKGDMVLSYTDALFESLDGADGKQLGTNGLLNLLNSLGDQKPESIISDLLDSIKELNSSNLNGDDVTLLLARVNNSRVSIKNELLAPFRLISRLTGRT